MSETTFGPETCLREPLAQLKEPVVDAESHEVIINKLSYLVIAVSPDNAAILECPYTQCKLMAKVLRTAGTLEVAGTLNKCRKETILARLGRLSNS